MNKILISLFSALLIAGCSIHQNRDDNENGSRKKSESSILLNEIPIKSKRLNEELDKIISREDRMSKSFYIVFKLQNNECILKLISNLDYYNSKTMIGYFRYKNKVISIYSYSSSCIENMIDLKKLSTGKIEELTDSYEEIISEYEPYEREFRIEKNERLVLVRERR